MHRAIILVFFLAPAARGGLHYSGEPIAELPSQWRGFLLDHRALRTIATPAAQNSLAHPLREHYRDATAKLVQIGTQRSLTADETADLGALHVRLGAIDAAIGVLRTAHRDNPDHFRAAANLGTAYQLKGDFDQSILALRDAVRLAPAKLKKAEELHLRLVTLRRAEARDAQTLDDLFGVRYADAAPKLPADAATLSQQLALWLPADGRLLWQLGELARATGDVRTAAAILDGCVTEFALGHPDLRRRRQEYRAAADALTKRDPATRADAQAAHDGHQPTVTFRSPRPLLRRFDAARLPPIRPDGLNPVPWALLGETVIERARPRFPGHLQQLDGKRVVLTGYMQPIGDGLEVGSFLLMEYPVGCWFCEVPEPTGMVMVDLPAGKVAAVTRNLVRVEGRLALNATDPEHFLYTIREARVAPPD